MKKALAFVLLLLLFIPVFAQVDTTYQGKAGIADVADEDPGLLFVMTLVLIGWIGIFFLCIIGVLIMAAITLAFAAAGIITSSIIVGWYRRSVYSGVKWFIYLSFAVAGALGGAMGSFMLSVLIDTSYSKEQWLGWGIPIGIIGGLLSALGLIKISRYVYDRYFMKKEIAA